jgi:hypothetical protein
VFGLLVVEIVALIAIISMRPFESSRLNAIMVYMLGISKVLTIALSAAFDTQFNLGVSVLFLKFVCRSLKANSSSVSSRLPLELS